MILQCLILVLTACSKKDSIDVQQLPQLSYTSGEYGPVACSIPATEPDGDTGCGAQCALSDAGGCYEETECRGARTEDGTNDPSQGSFGDVYDYLLSIGEIDPLEPGDPITHPALLDAMKRDGHAIIY